MTKNVTGALRQRFDQIAFLVDRKFPNYRRLQTLASNPYATSVGSGYGDLSKAVKEYKAELGRKTGDEISQLYEGERAKESTEAEEQARQDEQRRPFNQKEADADFVRWGKMPYWTLDEAIALSFGKAPESVTWELVRRHLVSSPFAKGYEQRRDLALRAVNRGDLYDPVMPHLFLAWAVVREIYPPDELVKEVGKLKMSAVALSLGNEQDIVPAAERLQDSNNPIQPNSKTSSRDKKLQEAAEALAKQWNEEYKRGFSKRDIARQLAMSDEWKHMTADRIERILRVTW